MAYNTGNPVGSRSPKDLLDNSENLDELVNSPTKESHPDRLGVDRKTWHGMEVEFDAAEADRAAEWAATLASAGYIGTGVDGAYEDYDTDGPLTIDAFNEIFTKDGEFYRAKPGTTLPYTATGTWATDQADFVAVGDAALRSELAAPGGARKVRDAVSRVDDISEIQALTVSVDGQAVEMTTTGRSGPFRRNASDISSSLVLATVASTSVDSGTDTITSAGHGLVDGNGVITETAVNGLSANTVYWIVGATTDTFQLSATFGGSAFDLTGTDAVTVKRLLDPEQGVYVISDGDSLTGADGAWVRQFGQAVSYVPELRASWFGAALDGSTPDTGKISASVNFLNELTETVGSATAVAGATLDFGNSKCYLPKKVAINAATGNRRINLRGDKAILIGDGTDDCFYYDGTYRVTVSGFEFQNFADCISFDTNNIAGATFTVRDCAAFNADTFITSRDYADSRSTVLNVENCFGHNTVTKQIKSTTDVLNVTGCNFQHGNPGGSAFDVNSRANFIGTMMVPSSESAVAGSRWIDFLATSDTTRWVTIDNCRLSGEFSGITAIYCFAQGNDGDQTGIGIRFSGGYAAAGAGGPGNNGSLVVLADNDAETATVTPNRITINDLNFDLTTNAKLITTESGLPLDVPTSLGFSVQIDEVSRKNVLVKSRYLDDLVKPYVVVESRTGYQNIVQTGDIDIDATLGGTVNIQASSAATVKNINFPFVDGGEIITICNQASTTNVTIEDDSTAGNGIYVGGSDLVIPARSAVMLAYTSNAGRWLKIG